MIGESIFNTIKNSILSVGNALPTANNPVSAAGNIISGVNSAISGTGKVVGGAFLDILSGGTNNISNVPKSIWENVERPLVTGATQFTLSASNVALNALRSPSNLGFNLPQTYEVKIPKYLQAVMGTDKIQTYQTKYTPLFDDIIAGKKPLYLALEPFVSVPLDATITSDLITSGAKSIVSKTKVNSYQVAASIQKMGLKDLSEATQKSQFRLLAKELHPDVGGSTAKMAELNQANSIINEARNSGMLVNEPTKIAKAMRKLSEIGLSDVKNVKSLLRDDTSSYLGVKGLLPEQAGTMPDISSRNYKPFGLSTREIKAKPINPLLEEAKKYKSADEFISKYRGSATQYTDYTPELRKYGTTEESARISDLGVDPEREVTIYRGVADIKIKNPKIVDGDFVTTDYESAYSYAGDNVISKRVKAKDLIHDYPDEFDPKDPFYMGAEFIYSDSKNGLIKYTDKQLTDIWNEAHKPTEIKLSPTSQKMLKALQKTTQPKVSPQSIMKSIKPSPNIVVRKNTNEMALLKQKLSNKSKLASDRAAIINRLKNTFDIKMENVKRAGKLKELKNEIKARDIDRVKGEIESYIKNSLPLKERGKYISLIKNARTQKDLIKAFVRVDNHAEQVIKDGLVKEINKQLKAIDKANNIDIKYIEKIQEIMSGFELKGHSKSKLKEIAETKRYLEEQAKLGNEVSMPRSVLESISILQRTPKEELTTAQLQGILQKIELLKNLGKLNLQNRKDVYQKEFNFRRAKLEETAIKWSTRDEARPAIGEKLRPIERVVNKMREAYDFIEKKHMALTPIDGMAQLTGMDYMKDDLSASMQNYLNHRLKTEIVDKELDIIKRNKLKEGNFERIDVYSVRLQKDGYEKLENIGISKEEADAVKLDKGEMEYYDFIRKVYDEDTLPIVQIYQRDVYNKPVKSEKNYTPFITDHEAFNDLEMWDRYGTLKEEPIRTKTVQDKFTKSRIGAGSQKIRLNAHKNFIQHIDDVAYMDAMGRDIKMYSEIVNSMADKMGDVSNVMWKQWLDLMARKGNSTTGRVAALDTLRKHMSYGVMGFKLSSALVQTTSFADGASAIGGEYMFKGTEHIALSKDWRKFVLDNFPEIRSEIGDDPAYLEMSGKIAEISMKPLVFLDGLVRTSTAAGAYEKLIKEAGKTVDLTKPDKEIITQVQKLVNRTQGSPTFWNQPLAISSGGLTGNKSVDKTILTFQSFTLSRWWNIRDSVWYSGIAKGNYVKSAMAMFWLFVVAGALEQKMRQTGNDIISTITGGDSKEDEDTISYIVGNSFSTIPVLGSIMNAIQYDSNPIPVANVLENSLGGMHSVITGKSEETKAKGAIKTLGAAGTMLGIPGSAQITDLAKNYINGTGASKSEVEKIMDKYGIGKSNSPEVDEVLKKYGIDSKSESEADKILKKYGID